MFIVSSTSLQTFSIHLHAVYISLQMDPQNTRVCISCFHLLIFLDHPSISDFTDHPHLF